MTTNPMKKIDMKFAFFGTSHIAVFVLDGLEQAGLVPALVVTIPQKPKGRGLEIGTTAVESWATARSIPVAYDRKTFESEAWDVAVVVDYGKVLSKSILEIPRHGFLNVHPSLLPRLRGASPMRSAILNDERKTGVTIMLVDEEMDHGAIVAQKSIEVAEWPPRNSDLEALLMRAAGKLLGQILPMWVDGEIETHPQNHDLATYSEKLKKEDGLLDLAGSASENMRKIRALEGWPGTYAFFERGGKKIRVQILDAHIESGALQIDVVKPEGKREMSYEEFLRSGAKPL
jgi:methionyl-tRNA formyltransferase